MISIRIQQLTKRFGTVTTLQNLDLAIEPGELFFLLGPSGCGKTTLLRSLAGFYLPEGFKDVAAYVVVLVMLMIKPNGLFGETLRKKV